MSINKPLIYKYLETILDNKQFNKSRISCDLLKYLVNASLEGINPKEYTIGVDLFGKKYASGEKQDANIRVYIHNLRKKLKTYYENDGRKDQVVFEIEKGKYNVLFHSRKELKSKKKHGFLIPFIASTFILVFILFFHFTFKKKQNVTWKNLPVWQEFEESNKKTLLVLGDFFFFSGDLPYGGEGVIRDFHINSEVDFEHLLDKNPELVQEISRTPYTFLSKMAVFCQHDIMKVFGELDAEIDIKLLSDIQPDDLKNYNIILATNFKNMGIMENTIKRLEYGFGIYANEVYYIEPSTDTGIIYSPEENEIIQDDYALVISKEGYNNNHFLFFLSTLDLGNISSVGQFTNRQHLINLENQYLNKVDPLDFKVLYKVEGINKIDLTSEVVLVE